MSIPPRAMFAAACRHAIEVHDEWDAPHCFQTLHWDGTSLACRTYACIMPDINPKDYPEVMAGMASKQRERDPGDPAYGYLLQIESFGLAEPRADAPEAERERFRRARLTRTFHKQPDAIEAAVAWCADIHGRLWNATKTRDHPGQITERFYPPHMAKRPGGLFVDALLAVAYATGAADWGLSSSRTASAN